MVGWVLWWNTAVMGKVAKADRWDTIRSLAGLYASGVVEYGRYPGVGKQGSAAGRRLQPGEILHERKTCPEQ